MFFFRLKQGIYLFRKVNERTKLKANNNKHTRDNGKMRLDISIHAKFESKVCSLLWQKGKPKTFILLESYSEENSQLIKVSGKFTFNVVLMLFYLSVAFCMCFIEIVMLNHAIAITDYHKNWIVLSTFAFPKINGFDFIKFFFWSRRTPRMENAGDDGNEEVLMEIIKLSIVSWLLIYFPPQDKNFESDNLKANKFLQQIRVIELA